MRNPPAPRRCAVRGAGAQRLAGPDDLLAARDYEPQAAWGSQ